MRPLVTALLSTSITAALATAALADDATPPVFALMDHAGDGSHVRVELASILLRNQTGGPVFRGSFLGQYITPGGLGGYLGLGMSMLRSDGEVGLGNLELGGVYYRAATSELDIGLAGGLVLPSSTKEELNAIGTVMSRPADLATALPDTTWARLGVSPTFHNGPLAVRIDLGLDIPVTDRDGMDPIWHIGAGVGFVNAQLAAAAELQTVAVESDTLTTLGVSLRYRSRVSPYLVISTPLERELRNEVLSVIAGITASL